MNVQVFTKEFYPIVKKWWENHPNWGLAIPLNSLSKNGIIVFIGEKPICAGWLYSTDSDLRLLEWVITNPESEKDERDVALDLLFESLLSKTNAADTIIGFSESESLKKRYLKHGFNLGDSKMDLLVLKKGG
jgi:hypothetical protein